MNTRMNGLNSCRYTFSKGRGHSPLPVEGDKELYTLVENALGHPLEWQMFNALAHIQTTMRQNHYKLVEQLMRKAIPPADYLAQLEIILTTAIKDNRELLGDEQFCAIFGEDHAGNGLADQSSFLSETIMSEHVEPATIDAQLEIYTNYVNFGGEIERDRFNRLLAAFYEFTQAAFTGRKVAASILFEAEVRGKSARVVAIELWEKFMAKVGYTRKDAKRVYQAVNAFSAYN